MINLLKRESIMKKVIFALVLIVTMAAIPRIRSLRKVRCR